MNRNRLDRGILDGDDRIVLHELPVKGEELLARLLLRAIVVI